MWPVVRTVATPTLRMRTGHSAADVWRHGWNRRPLWCTPAGRTPARVEASAALAKSGVDASFSGWLDFGDGFTATIECSFDAPERQSLEIVGTEAALLVDRAHTPGPEDAAITLRHRDGRLVKIIAGAANPYRAMIEHFQSVVRGEAAPRRSCAASITLLTVLERLRAAAGLSS